MEIFNFGNFLFYLLSLFVLPFTLFYFWDCNYTYSRPCDFVPRVSEHLLTFFRFPSLSLKCLKTSVFTLVGLGLCGCVRLWWGVAAPHGDARTSHAVASLLWNTGSRHVRLQAAWAQQLWCAGLVALLHAEPSQTGVEPMSPALAGRFLSTKSPEKASLLIGSFLLICLQVISTDISNLLWIHLLFHLLLCLWILEFPFSSLFKF